MRSIINIGRNVISNEGRGRISKIPSCLGRNIGIKIGRDIDIDINDTDFFKVKPSPQRHLYPEMCHPKNTNSAKYTNISINTDCKSELSVKVESARSINISICMKTPSFPEDN